MALTAADKAEIQSMIKAAKTGKTTRKRTGKRKPSQWTPYFKAAIKDAVKEFNEKGGNYKTIKEKYLKAAKVKYNKEKK